MFCRKCGKAIPDDSDFCLKCGAKVVLAEEKSTSTASEPAVQMQSSAPTAVLTKEPSKQYVSTATVTKPEDKRVCPKCGKDYPSERQYCSECGEMLVTEDEALEAHYAHLNRQAIIENNSNHEKIYTISKWVCFFLTMAYFLVMTIISAVTSSKIGGDASVFFTSFFGFGLGFGWIVVLIYFIRTVFLYIAIPPAEHWEFDLGVKIAIWSFLLALYIVCIIFYLLREGARHI